jgi:hypothetical protein
LTNCDIHADRWRGDRWSHTHGMNAEHASRAGHAARAVANDYGEERTVVRSRRRRCRVGRRSRATDSRRVPLPMVAERGCARCGHRESRRLPNCDIHADWRRGDRWSPYCRRAGRIAFGSAGVRYACAPRKEEPSC